MMMVTSHVVIDDLIEPSPGRREEPSKLNNYPVVLSSFLIYTLQFVINKSLHFSIPISPIQYINSHNEVYPASQQTTI